MSEWCVEVDESRVFGTQRGSEWWTWFRNGQPEHRFVAVGIPTLMGLTYQVACDSRHDADWLCAHMLDFAGIPKAAVRVRRR